MPRFISDCLISCKSSSPKHKIIIVTLLCLVVFKIANKIVLINKIEIRDTIITGYPSYEESLEGESFRDLTAIHICFTHHYISPMEKGANI